jgi:hypothetical protein
MAAHCDGAGSINAVKNHAQLPIKQDRIIRERAALGDFPWQPAYFFSSRQWISQHDNNF